MKVSYPLKEINSSNVQNNFGHANYFGNYPISAQNTWHGGIHLESTNEPILNIADGRIIVYRFNDNYEEYELDGKKIKYSSAFVLIQHDYLSEKEQKMTFYSLYHHVMPKSNITNQNFKLPNFVSEKKYTVKRNKGILNVGLRGRKLKNNKIAYGKNDDDTIVVVIPIGSRVYASLDENNKEIKKGNWLKITYTDADGKMYDDIYISTKNSKGKLKIATISEFTYEIITKEDPDNSILGAIVRTESNKTSEIVKIIKKDTTLEIDDSYINKKWIKLKDNTGYILKTSVDKKNVLSKDCKTNTIIACDIPIKAGETIGYIGKFGFENFIDYKATHLEVFTTDNIGDFLKNKRKDGDTKKHYTKLDPSIELKINLPSITVNLKVNTPIKVLDIKDNYAKIEIKTITKVVKHNYLTGWNKSARTYKIKKEHFEKVNAIFNNMLSKEDHLTYKSQSGENRTVYLKTEKLGEKFWIDKTALADVEEQIIPKAPTLITTTRTPKVNDTTKLKTAVTKAYIELPIKTDIETICVEEETLINIQRSKKVKDDNDKWWYKIAIAQGTGWIKKTDLFLFTAYNWEEFGFEAIDAGNEYIYSVKEILDAGNTDPFINTLWNKAIDTNGDKVLQVGELNRAFYQPKKVKKLAHLVCKHKTEWSYTFNEIKSEIEELKLFDYGINLEKDAAKKQELEAKRDTILKKLEPKVKNLMFWQEAKSATYTPTETKKTTAETTNNNNFSIFPVTKQPTETEDTKPERMFPTADIVHHFHPIAWVEQMKLILGNPNTIEIIRQSEKWTGKNKSSMTFGTFQFGNIEGYISEPYGEETSERGKDKRIPKGTYNLKWHVTDKYPKNKYTSQSKFGKKWNLDFPILKKGVVCVYNKKVPTSRGILIHAGQDGGWTTGCILPSKTLDKTLNKRNMKIKESVEILYKILNRIDEIGIENVKLIIKDEIE
jgi:hypothetical protein